MVGTQSLVQTVAEFLIPNQDVIIKDLKKEYSSNIKRMLQISGHKQVAFRKHLVDVIKCRLREILIENVKLNSEQAYLVQEDDLIKNIIKTIIEGVLNEQTN